MNELLDSGIRALLLGMSATAMMDLGGIALKHLAGVAPPNYALVGRWVAYMPRGRFRHAPIGASAPLRHEAVIGWLVHYTVGVVFASVLLIWSPSWICQPSLAPALIVGLGSLVAPLLLMQPALGAGIASSRTPNPRAARLKSLLNHLLFGIGLYVAGQVMSVFGVC